MSAAEDFVRQRIAARMRRLGAAVPEDLRDVARLRSSPPRDAAGFAWIAVELIEHRSDYYAEVNAITGEPLSWSCDALRMPAGAEIAPDDCLRAAIEAAQPPADAVLVEAKYDAIADTPYFSATWIHVVRGLPVDDDWMKASVNGKTGVCYAVSRKWHDVDESPSMR